MACACEPAAPAGGRGLGLMAAGAPALTEVNWLIASGQSKAGRYQIVNGMCLCNPLFGCSPSCICRFSQYLRGHDFLNMCVCVPVLLGKC